MNNQPEKYMRKGEKEVLKMLLRKLRLEYNLYDEDDKEVIDAINSLQEELEWNVKDLPEE